MPDWFDGIERVGVAVTVLTFLGLGLWKACRYLGLRLFGEEKGIVTTITAKYVLFMETYREHLPVIRQIVQADHERAGKVLDFTEQMTIAHGPGGACNPAPLKKAGVAAADALVAIAEGDTERVKLHAQQIKKHLDPATES